MKIDIRNTKTYSIPTWGGLIALALGATYGAQMWCTAIYIFVLTANLLIWATGLVSISMQMKIYEKFATPGENAPAIVDIICYVGLSFLLLYFRKDVAMLITVACAILDLSFRARYEYHRRHSSI